MSDDIKIGAVKGSNEFSHGRHLETMKGEGSGSATPADKPDEVKIDTREVTLLSDEMDTEYKQKPLKPLAQKTFNEPDLPTLLEMELADAMAAAATGLVQELGKDHTKESHREEPRNKICIPLNPSLETGHQTKKRGNQKIPVVLTTDDSLNVIPLSKQDEK